MSSFEKLKIAKDSQFKRLTGVKRETFNLMVKIVKEFMGNKVGKKRSGRKPKLCVEDEILMLLQYYREYRTYAHIAWSFGIDESNCYRGIRKIEDILIKSRKFSLPGKKALRDGNNSFEIVIVDATETQIERPKVLSAART